MPDKLPKGWVKTTLGEVCAMNPRPSYNELPPEHTEVSFVPMAAVEEESGRLDASEVRTLAAARKGYTPFKENDVIFAKITPCMENGKIALATGLRNGLAYGSTEYFVFRPYDGLLPRYVLHFLLQPSFRNEAQRRMTGAVGQKRVPSNYLATHSFPLPPSREQERIVAKLDELLSRVAAGEAAARRALERLKRYRAAVLHAAVTGELTRDWRKSHKPDETGAQLLKRLLKERRARWEEAELKRLQDAGKPPKDDKWKKKYQEPVEPKQEGQLEVPSDWVWASIDQVGQVETGSTPSKSRADFFGGNVPFYKPSDLDAGYHVASSTDSLTAKGAEHARLIPARSVLVTCIGATIGKTGFARKAGATNQQINALIPTDAGMAEFLYFVFASPRMQDAIRSSASATTLPILNKSKFERLPSPLPPAAEQDLIVREVENRLAAADRLAAALNRQLERARATRQSLLREAFAGKIVPQDPTDEPASVLLEHIHAVRETHDQKPKVKIRRVTNASAKGQPASTILEGIHAVREPRDQKPKVKTKRVTNASAKGQPAMQKRPPQDRASEPPKVVVPVTLDRSSPSPRQVRLILLKLYDDYNSLKAAEFPLRGIVGKAERLSPLCLVGLNGSGKSNLIEALSEIFCHVELSLLPWESITGKQREIPLRFDLEYQLVASRGAKPTTVRLENPGGGSVVFKIIGDDSEEVITDGEHCRALLPTRVLGYSSGLNETISIPYFRTAAIYSQEVLRQAQREKANTRKKLPDVPDSNTFFMDYECNALILVSNYLLQPRPRLGLFRLNLRIDSLHAFDIRFHGKYRGNKPVELTRELRSYLEAFRSCANSIERAGDTEVFRFSNPKAAAQKLKVAFKTAGGLFRALYKLSLLNPLALSGKKRKFYLREDAKAGQLERPPTISREDRIFSVENIRVNLTKPKRPIDYAAISDGEHQFLQVFGSVTLFDEPGCVFLLDEPETHFNPRWRRFCIQWLADMKKTQRQELMISTHSPFVVSGCHKKHVLNFKRDGGHCVCASVSDETFGASYDYLLARLFCMETMIAGEAIEAMRKLVKTTSIEKLRQAIPMFGESLEKRFIFERISQLEAQKKKRKK